MDPQEREVGLMTTVRAQCPDCGDVQLGIDRSHRARPRRRPGRRVPVPLPGVRAHGHSPRVPASSTSWSRPAPPKSAGAGPELAERPDGRRSPRRPARPPRAAVRRGMVRPARGLGNEPLRSNLRRWPSGWRRCVVGGCRRRAREQATPPTSNPPCASSRSSAMRSPSRSSGSARRPARPRPPRRAHRDESRRPRRPGLG